MAIHPIGIAKMEKEKSALPKHLKITKTKDGTPEILIGEIFKPSEFFGIFLSGLIFFLGLTVLYASDKTGLAWPLRLFFAVPFGLISLIFLVGILSLILTVNKVRLESDTITTINRPFGLYVVKHIPLKDISSIRVEQILLPNDKKTPFVYSIKVHLNNGETEILISPFEKPIHAMQICDFINSYYGLDEKPKTNHQQPKTEN